MLKFYKKNTELSLDGLPQRRARTFFAGLVVLLISLQSFYSAALGFAPFPLLGLLGMIVFVVLVPRPKKYRTYFVKVNAVLASYLIALLISVFCIFLYGDEIDAKRLIGFGLVMLAAGFAPHFVRRIHLGDVLGLVIIVHAALFLLQFGLFYGFGFDLNYIALVFPAETKGLGGGFSHEILGDFRRLGGLYNEPGTYSAFMAPLIALKARDYVRSSFDKWIVNVSLLTVVLTFSTFGIIFAAMIVAGLWAVYGVRRTLGIVVLAGVGVLGAIPYFIFRFVTRVASGEESGTEFRLKFVSDVADFVFSGISPLLIGAGLLNSDLTDKIEIVAAVNDNGLIMFLVLTVGPMFAAAFCWTILRSSWKAGFFSFVAASICFMSKASPFWLFFPFVLTCLLFHSAVRSRA